ncbi:MAG: plasmid pRiA4b ORF-3 family protein [Leptolyngbya sp. SIOISBB]|nr:plasmid pRiA4b ORF-3 family protein [Leptolyngbya sp. SIOISBB]
MIWRRLLVSGNHTIADLHYILQIAMGWSDDHLNRFTIHGKEYGVYHSGGIGFSDDPEMVQLADLQLRERKKFGYEYDFTDRW